MSASTTGGTYPRATRFNHSIASGLAAPIRQAALAVWRVLRGVGEQRMRQHLFCLADQYQLSNPALARSLRDSARHAGEQ